MLSQLSYAPTIYRAPLWNTVQMEASTFHQLIACITSDQKWCDLLDGQVICLPVTRKHIPIPFGLGRLTSPQADDWKIGGLVDWFPNQRISNSELTTVGYSLERR